MVDGSMENEVKIEARKQYFHYFRVWFIAAGVLAIIFLIVMGTQWLGNKVARGNMEAPAERVFDYADVLSDLEEKKLREYIAKCEAEYEIDLVLVTMNEDVESQGYWDTVMMNTADDFYDENKYGYNVAYGDGALLLDNWYVDAEGSQKGSWLCTSGFVERCMGDYEIDEVLDAVYFKIDSDPYQAYRAYIDTTCDIVARASGKMEIPWFVIVFAPIIVAVIFATKNLYQSPAKNGVTANTYVAGGQPIMNATTDEFIRKDVVRRHIESSSGGRSGGGGGGSRGGGHHTSRSGRSHGGGGRRR